MLASWLVETAGGGELSLGDGGQGFQSNWVSPLDHIWGTPVPHQRHDHVSQKKMCAKGLEVKII